MVVILSPVLQAIAVLGVTAIFAMVARRPSARHAFWTAGVAGSLLLPIAAFVLPTIRITEPQFLRATIETVAPERTTPPRSVAAPAADPLDGVQLPGRAPAPFDWATLLGITWALGASTFLLVVTRRARRVRALLRAARPITSPAVLEEWRRLVEHYSIKPTTATLVSTTDRSAPATCGLMRSHVMLPAHHHEWSGDRLRAVLAHELAHVARRDCLAQAVAQIASAIYWFSPLHRYAERMMAVERERACDEFVLRSGVSPRSYALALVDAERDALHWRSAASLLAMAPPDKSELEHRVEHILEGAEPQRAMGVAGRVAIASFTVAIVVMTSSVRLEAALPQIVDGLGASQGREPDQRGDSIASPSSERIPGTPIPTDAMVRAVMSGPDSAFAMHLVHATERVPQGDEDLVGDRARWALMQSDGGLLIEPLVRRLADSDWRVRAYAAWALGLSRDRRATTALVAQMSHPLWRLRAMAASALESIGDLRAREAMLRALSDDAWQVRSVAVSYLAALNDPELARVIRGRLSDRHIAVRQAARRALGE